MYTINCSVHFDAAHYLNYYSGKCKEIHGHRWQIGVQVSGEELDEAGILIDFHHIKRYLREITETWDHHLLNQIAPFDRINPTSENLARYIYEYVEGKLSEEFPRLHLDHVEVYETPEAKAIFSKSKEVKA